MTEPLSASNARLKDIRKLLAHRPTRAERRQFLADGPKAVAEAIRLPGCVVEVFHTNNAHRVVEEARQCRVETTLVDDRALASLSDSVTPAGVVALCNFVDVPWSSLLAPKLVAILADVRDPGNAGTVIRVADAAGVDAVVLAGDAVDLYNPKTIRASVGSAFHVPVVIERDVQSAVDRVREVGLQVLAADGAGEAELYAIDLSGPTAWLFGNEAWGLPEELAAAADVRVRIPVYGQAESLNLATAAALCLYESARQRR